MSHSISIGEFELTIVSGGQLWIDGGNMFGVIPRALWERRSPPDAQNRILLETNCVLVRAPDSVGLIDTGYGSKAAAKVRSRFSMEGGDPIRRNLAAHGVQPEDIDWVLLTHLHFDHAGGCTYRDDTGQRRPTFSRARHIVQRTEWEDATGEIPELAGAYFIDDFTPLMDAGLVELVEETAEVIPGITAQRTGGHTRGHQIVRIESAGHSAVCPADICPMAVHLPTFWTMAYDQFPLTVRRVKSGLLNDILENNRTLLFSHDPKTPIARLSRDDDGNLIASGQLPD